MTTPADRAFAYFNRGELRDEKLRQFRIGLRVLVNPETGVLFTQDEIAMGTQQGSLWWIEADADDLIHMAEQSRALMLADQVRPDRANTNWLHGYHGDQWLPDGPLGASPGSGPVTIQATVGTVYAGSTTIPDPTAVTFRDVAQLRYQVLTTVTTDGSGIAGLTLVGIDTGTATNLQPGAQLTIDQNPPLGSQPIATVTDVFKGGFAAESNADFAARLRSTIRHRAGAGNNAQFRAWARDSSVAVLDAYVYSCALHAGSTLVCITQKRGASVGPLALIPSVGTLAATTAYLTPPASPVVPTRVFVLATDPVSQPTDAIIQLSQAHGNAAGWRDVTPWPGLTAAAGAITIVTDQQHFRMHSDTALPGGAGSLSGAQAPHLMAWDISTSRFESLIVTSVTSFGGNLYDVVLTAPPSGTLVVTGWISPDMARREDVGIAAENYFDSLGPGEVVNLATDSRADRAARFPDPAEESPSRGGQAIVTGITDGLGSALATASLFSMTTTTPAIPANPASGPSKLTLGNFAVYELP